MLTNNEVLSVPMSEFFPKEISKSTNSKRKRDRPKKVLQSGLTYDGMLSLIAKMDWANDMPKLNMNYHVFHYIIEKLELTGGINDLRILLISNSEIVRNFNVMSIINSIDYITNLRESRINSNKIRVSTLLSYIGVFSTVPLKAWNSLFLSRDNWNGILDTNLADLLFLAKKINTNCKDEFKLTGEFLREHIFQRIANGHSTYIDEVLFNIDKTIGRTKFETKYDLSFDTIRTSAVVGRGISAVIYKIFIDMGPNIVDKDRLDLFMSMANTALGAKYKKKLENDAIPTQVKEPFTPVLLNEQLNPIQRYCNKHSLSLERFSEISHIGLERLKRMNKLSHVHLSLTELLKLEKYIGFTDETMSKRAILSLCDTDLCKLLKLSSIFVRSVASITRLANNRFIMIRRTFFGDSYPFLNDWNDSDLDTIRAIYCEVDYDGLYQLLSNNPTFVEPRPMENKKTHTILKSEVETTPIAPTIIKVQPPVPAIPEYIYQPVIESYGYDEVLARVLKGCL